MKNEKVDIEKEKKEEDKIKDLEENNILEEDYLEEQENDLFSKIDEIDNSLIEDTVEDSILDDDKIFIDDEMISDIIEENVKNRKNKKTSNKIKRTLRIKKEVGEDAD